MKQKITQNYRRIIVSLLPFWLYMFIFQLGGSLHYTLLGPIGDKIISVWLIGLLVGLSAGIQLVLDVPAGHILDRVGYAKMLRFTAIVFAMAAFVLLFDLTPWVYVLTLILSALGWLFFGPGIDAYMLSMAPKSSAGRYAGLSDIARSLGSTIAIILFALLFRLPLYALGAFLFVIFLCALFFSFYIPNEKHSVHKEKKIETHHYRIRRSPLLHVLRTLKRLNPASTMLVIMSFASSTFYAVIWFVIPLTLAKTSGSVWEGISLAIFDIAVVFVGGFMGKLADSGNKKILTLLGLIVYAICGTLLGFSVGIWFLVLGFVAASGEELAGVSLWAWLNNLDKDHAEDGLVAGTITFFGDLGWTIGPIAAGILYTLVGPAWTILSGALLLCFVLLIYIAFVFTNISLRHAPLPVSSKKPPLRKHKH